MADENQEIPPQQDPFANQSTAANLWYEARLCLGALTRIPVFTLEYSGRSSLARASWAFPLIGALIGLTGALALWLGDKFGLASELCALLAITTMILLTGAVPENGLAKTAQGFGFGGDAPTRLAASAEARASIHGMLALIVVFSARWMALSDVIAVSLSDGILVLTAAAAISRGVLPYVMHALPIANDGGLVATAERPEAQPVFIALGIAAVTAWIAFGFSGAILVLIVSGVSAFIIATSARRLLGGQTGEVLGAIQQVTEAAILITAAGLSS